MTPDQMAELAARLRTLADALDWFDGNGRKYAPDARSAADLIESMSQRVPLTEQQIRESFEHTVHGLNLPLDRLGDGYRSTYTNIAWQVAFGTANRLHRSMAQRVPLSEEQIYQVIEAARESYRAHTTGIRGQMLTIYDDMDWHLVRAVEQAHGIRSEATTARLQPHAKRSTKQPARWTTKTCPWRTGR